MALFSPYSNFNGFLLNLLYILIFCICAFLGLLVPGALFQWICSKCRVSLNEDTPWMTVFSCILSLLGMYAFAHLANPVISKIPAPILSPSSHGELAEPDYH